MIQKFNEKELISKGIYKTYGEFGGAPYADVEILDTPISARENTIHYFTGKEYQWIPDWSSDYYDFSADCIPDVIACGMSGGVDSFGVTWTPVENGLPAMVKPGNPTLKDIADWRSLEWPDIDSWDWEGCVKNYEGVIDGSRVLRPYIQIGLFERMISLLDFDGALFALIDNPDECKAFLDKVADYNIDLIDHYCKYFPIDAICFLDDWSAQRAPFFSVEMAKDILFPRLKRIVDHVKSKGLLFTWHSCGNGTAFVPLMLEAGIDGWQLQNNAVDMEEAMKLANGKLIFETSEVFPLDTSEETIISKIKETITHYGNQRTVTYCFCDEYYMTSPLMRNTAYQATRELVYQTSLT